MFLIRSLRNQWATLKEVWNMYRNEGVNEYIEVLRKTKELQKLIQEQKVSEASFDAEKKEALRSVLSGLTQNLAAAAKASEKIKGPVTEASIREQQRRMVEQLRKTSDLQHKVLRAQLQKVIMKQGNLDPANVRKQEEAYAQLVSMITAGTSLDKMDIPPLDEFTTTSSRTGTTANSGSSTSSNTGTKVIDSVGKEKPPK